MEFGKGMEGKGFTDEEEMDGVVRKGNQQKAGSDADFG